MPKRLAYLGPAGTYTEEAALLYDPSAELEPFPTIAAIGLAVSSEITDEGVVPIENSLEGSVTFTLDLLIQESQLSIFQEVLLPIDHYLMVNPGVKLADIEVVYSHPQSLAQCREFLERCLPKAQQMASLSNSAAVADMQKSDVGAAAIAPRRAAELYNAEIIGAESAGLAKQRHPVRNFGAARPYAHRRGQDVNLLFLQGGRSGAAVPDHGRIRHQEHQLVEGRVPAYKAVAGRLYFSDRLRGSPAGPAGERSDRGATGIGEHDQDPGVLSQVGRKGREMRLALPGSHRQVSAAHITTTPNRQLGGPWEGQQARAQLLRGGNPSPHKGHNHPD